MPSTLKLSSSVLADFSQRMKCWAPFTQFRARGLISPVLLSPFLHVQNMTWEASNQHLHPYIFLYLSGLQCCSNSKKIAAVSWAHKNLKVCTHSDRSAIMEVVTAFPNFNFTERNILSLLNQHHNVWERRARISDITKGYNLMVFKFFFFVTQEIC